MTEQTTQINVRWMLEVQKFKACPRHAQGGEPFDPACPDCEITDPPIQADTRRNDGED